MVLTTKHDWFSYTVDPIILVVYVSNIYKVGVFLLYRELTNISKVRSR